MDQNAPARAPQLRPDMTRATPPPLAANERQPLRSRRQPMSAGHTVAPAANERRRSRWHSQRRHSITRQASPPDRTPHLSNIKKLLLITLMSYFTHDLMLFFSFTLGISYIHFFIRHSHCYVFHVLKFYASASRLQKYIKLMKRRIIHNSK